MLTGWGQSKGEARPPAPLPRGEQFPPAGGGGGRMASEARRPKAGVGEAPNDKLRSKLCSESTYH